MSAPGWVEAWLGETREQRLHGLGWHAVRCVGERFTRARVTVPGAGELDDERLGAATRAAYDGLRGALDGAHPVRIWNFVPGILGAASAGRDRYMVFNAGRHAAFDDWFGTLDPKAFAAAMPAATGVGTDGADLIIDCLADRVPGTAIENPRQHSAFRYSTRYGPRPPCFSRATRVAAPVRRPGSASAAHDRAHRLLISGTASIVGEDSTHAGDLLAQLDETLSNLQALIEAAGGRGLQDLVDARLYHVDAEAGTPLLAALAQRLEMPVEAVRVTLCRPELGLEIEAVAAFD